MKRCLTLFAVLLIALSVSAQSLVNQKARVPDGFDPMNVAHPIDPSVLQEIAKTAKKVNVNLYRKLNRVPKKVENPVDTVDYFTASQSYYSNYQFKENGGDLKTYNIGVAVNGNQVTFKNFFNLYNPADWAPCYEQTITGTYDANSKTITIPASDAFDNATVIGKISNYYIGTLCAGRLDEFGLLTTDENLVLHVDGDFERIYTDGQAVGVSLWSPDGSYCYGPSASSALFKSMVIQNPDYEAGTLVFPSEVYVGETFPNIPISTEATLLNMSKSATDYSIELSSDPEDAFTVDEPFGTLEPHATKIINLTLKTDQEGEVEGLANIETENNEDLLMIQLSGTILTPPDFSSIVKNGDFMFGTDINYPFNIGERDGHEVAISYPMSWNGQKSTMDISMIVPEGKLGKFSFKGICNITSQYNFAGGYFVDDLATPYKTYMDPTATDISSTIEMAPGQHTIRFQFDCYNRIYDPTVSENNRLYVWDLDLQTEDLVANAAVIDDNVANMGYAIIPNGGSASKSDNITLVNKGSNRLIVNAITSDNPEFTASVEELDHVSTMQTLKIPVYLSTKTPGEKTANLTIETSAGTFYATAKGKVIEEQDFSQVVTEGYEYLTVDNDPNFPFIVDGDCAYNLNSTDPDDVNCVSMVKFSFTIPEGKKATLYWEGYSDSEGAWQTDYGQIEISHPMNGGTKGIWEAGDAGSDELFANDPAWANFLECTPGNHWIAFEYLRNGDGHRDGDSKLWFKNFKLQVEEFTAYSATLVTEKVDFEPIYQGENRWAKATVILNNTGSLPLTVESITADDPFSANVPETSADYGKNLEVPFFFYPDSKGTFTGTVTIHTNAGDFAVPCTGSTLDDTGIVYVGDLEDDATGWTFVDADEDGNSWRTAYWLFGGGQTEAGYKRYCHSGYNLIGSASMSAYGDALNPDNYAISPAIAIPAEGATLSYYVADLDPNHCDEYYTVYVSESNNVDEITENGDVLFDGLFELPESYDMIPWVNKTFDLSAYAGKTVYLTFRHHNCSGQYLLMLDDIFVYEKGFDPAAINDVSNADMKSGVAGYYTVDGQYLSAPQKGVNIVKYNSGATRKVVVK